MSHTDNRRLSTKNVKRSCLFLSEKAKLPYKCFFFIRFKSCLGTTSAISSSGRGINFKWIAYQDVKSSDGFSTRRLITLYTTGTKCIDQKYEKVSPNIYFYSANSTIQFSNALYNSRGNQINIAQIIIHKSNQMLVFDERGKPDYPEENFS